MGKGCGVSKKAGVCPQVTRRHHRSSWGLAGVAALGWEPALSGVGSEAAIAVKSL